MIRVDESIKELSLFWNALLSQFSCLLRCQPLGAKQVNEIRNVRHISSMVHILCDKQMSAQILEESAKDDLGRAGPAPKIIRLHHTLCISSSYFISSIQKSAFLAKSLEQSNDKALKTPRYSGQQETSREPKNTQIYCVIEDMRIVLSNVTRDIRTVSCIALLSKSIHSNEVQKNFLLLLRRRHWVLKTKN